MPEITSIHRAGRVMLALLTIGLSAVTGCGGGEDPSGPTGPGTPPPPPPQPPGPPPGPAPVGYAVYAVDLANRLLLFGTESPGTISKIKKITGLPILSRIVGIDFRPSNGKLYGVGNDSRVYVIDTATAVATPVSTTPFSPKISQYFEVHFGTGIDLKTERMRLIATESGGNWSIDLDNGTAVMGKKPRYAAGGTHAGEMPMIIGLAYQPPALGAAGDRAIRASVARLTAAGPCEEMMYAISAKYAELIGSCDPNEGDFTNLGQIPGITAVAGCGELKFDHGPGNLWKVIQDGAGELNKMGYIDENGIPHWTGKVADDSPIQAMAFAPGGVYSQQKVGAPAELQATPAVAARSTASASAGALPACS